jgi:hypothetical protein
VKKLLISIVHTNQVGHQVNVGTDIPFHVFVKAGFRLAEGSDANDKPDGDK